MDINAQIVGQYVSPDRIEISIPCKRNLQEGQRVLVCRPTNNTIANYATGKVIGRKEHVLGTGIIALENGGYVVKTDKKAVSIVNRMKRESGVKKAAPIAHGNGIKAKIWKGAKFQSSQKVNLRSKMQDVIIKIIED